MCSRCMAGAGFTSLPCRGCAYRDRAHYQWSRFEIEMDDVVPLAVVSSAPPRGEECSRCRGQLAVLLSSEKEQQEDPDLDFWSIISVTTPNVCERVSDRVSFGQAFLGQSRSPHSEGSKRWRRMTRGTLVGAQSRVLCFWQKHVLSGHSEQGATLQRLKTDFLVAINVGRRGGDVKSCLS